MIITPVKERGGDGRCAIHTILHHLSCPHTRNNWGFAGILTVNPHETIAAFRGYCKAANCVSPGIQCLDDTSQRSIEVFNHYRTISFTEVRCFKRHTTSLCGNCFFFKSYFIDHCSSCCVRANNADHHRSIRAVSINWYRNFLLMS